MMTIAQSSPDAVASVQVDTTIIVADTNELQTDWTNGGRLDLLIDAIKAMTDKIDGAVVDGLLGTNNSLAYKQHEVEKHLHNTGYMYGQDPGDTFLLADGLTPWQLTAGAGEAYGTWVQLSNGDEIVAGPKYDPHLLQITQASANAKLYYVQLGTGTGGSQVPITCASFFPSASLRQVALEIICPRVNNTDLLWARSKCKTNGATISFALGLHVYAG